MKEAGSDTDLGDEQWKLLEPMLPAARRLGRPRTPLRKVVDAILYLSKTGCQWRSLPGSYPPWKTVYHHFRQWSRSHVLDALNDRLRTLVRRAEGRRSRPTTALLDSQTVRSEGHGGGVGYDAAKKTKGRKRFILTDSLGLLLGTLVVPANRPERAGARDLLEPLLPWHPWLKNLWADAGYDGAEFARWVRERRPGLHVQIARRSATARGFHVLPRRWVVERIFGWLVRCRRLARDYEKTESSATAFILLAMIRLMLRRLA